MDAEQEYLELVRLKGEIAELKRNRKSGRSRPHKLVLMLAILDMAEEGLLDEKRIRFDDWLVRRFERYFDDYKQQDDRCQLDLPFSHLRTSPFWRHRVWAGQEEAYERLAASGRSPNLVKAAIEYAYLDDYAHSVIMREASRRNLRAFIVSILDSGCSEEAVHRARDAETKRRIRAYVERLRKGMPLVEKRRPDDAALAHWIRECKRAGLYEQGKLLYEKGGLNLGGLSERAVAEVEEDYNVCLRSLARLGSRNAENKVDDMVMVVRRSDSGPRQMG